MNKVWSDARKVTLRYNRAKKEMASTEQLESMRDDMRGALRSMFRYASATLTQPSGSVSEADLKRALQALRYVGNKYKNKEFYADVPPELGGVLDLIDRHAGRLGSESAVLAGQLKRYLADTRAKYFRGALLAPRLCAA